MNSLFARSQPLSQSDLWRQQSVFYERLGQDAWRGGFVPEYITSNPFIAHAYAQLVLAFWRDSLAAGKVAPDVPCYLVELGAGSGRFAYLFLTALTELLDAETGERQQEPAPNFVYVMTDVAQANLDAWQTHAWLAPFVEAGRLDFARFDASRDTELSLLVRGARLAPDEVENPGAKNPSVVIANYVFDSIPSDLYYVEDGALFARHITADITGDITVNAPESAPSSNSADPRHSPPLLDPAQLQIRHSHHPFDPNTLDDPALVAILRDHADKLDKTVFPLPVTAIDACRRLHTLLGESLLLLVGDKGYTTLAGLQAVGDPEKAVPGMAFHSGCFSVMVNFPALAHYAELSGGAALLPDHEPHRLGVAALLFGLEHASETRRAFARHIDAFGPDDFYALTQALEGQLATLTLHQILALLRLSRGDPQLLAGCLPALLQELDHLTPHAWDELRAAIARALRHDYPSTRRYDLAYSLGRLFFARAAYTEALEHFQRSLAQQGANSQMLYEMAVCQTELEQYAAAYATLEEVQALSPHHAAARDLRVYVRQKMSQAQTSSEG
jgi:hypothetical protein